MASSVGASPSIVADMAANISSTSQTAIAAMATAAEISQMDGQTTNVFSKIANVLYLVVRIVPGFVVWLAAFATFTLPAWVFTTFSMSLTFTMNVTTLYVHISFQAQQTNGSPD